MQWSVSSGVLPTVVLVLSLGRKVVFIVEENSFCRPVEVIELAALERPEKRRQAKQAEKQRGRDEQRQNVHQRSFPSLFMPTWPSRKRSALSVTRMEEDDIAKAAISGVTNPATAIGTATAL